MAVNPAIAMGVRGIELADPLAQYGKIAAIQQAQQQNALAQLQMRQAEREQETTNALNAAYRDAYNPQTGDVDLNRLRSSLVTGGYGAKLPDLEKKFGELKTQRLTQQKTEGEIQGQALTRQKTEADIAATLIKQARDLLPSVNSPEAYANWRSYTLQNLPGLANVIPEQYSPEAVRGLMLEADKALEQHFVNQNLGGTTHVVAMPKYGQGPARTIEGTEASMTMAPGEAQRLQNDAVRIKQEGQRLGLEGRRVTVLEANARRDADPLPKAPPGYRYTSAGDLKAIPGGPAATKQVEAAEKKESGKAQATDILNTLEGAYLELDRIKAIPSEQRGAVANVLASLGATQAGQTASRALGTPAQTQREVIASARNQLFAAVKNATGLSAQNLNSNVEFTTWINSLTDPSRSIESNKAIIENMRRFIAGGGTYTAKKEGSSAPAAGARPAGVGADWTLMTDKNGNKAWVSPDHKSFKEVK